MKVLLPGMLMLSLLTSAPVYARGGSHGHHHGGHLRSHYSTLPATSAAPRYCASTQRRVLDLRDCPEATIAPPAETPVSSTNRDNR